MPEPSCTLVDTSALATPRFLEWAQHELAVAPSMRLVLPSPTLVRSARGPRARATLEAWVDALRREGRAFLVEEHEVGAARVALARLVTRAVAKGLEVRVVTEDVAWAEALRAAHPTVVVERLVGTSVAPWFAPARRPTEVFSPATALQPLDDATTPDQPRPDPGVLLGGDLAGSRLGGLLGEGGEGWVFELRAPSTAAASSDLVAKVLRRPTASRRRKIDRMCEVHAPPGIAWPRAVLVDAAGAFLGFTLPRAEGTSLDRFIARARSASSSVDRRDLVAVARGFVERVAAVHAVGALVGDLQPANAIVGLRREVTIIDADSFQLEGFACGVGVVDYLHPHLVDRDLRTVLRSPVHEAFALATVLFHVVMAGWHPYAHRGGTTPVENQRKALFPYGARRALSDVPLGLRGPAARLWSHLAPAIREAFVDSFVRLAPPGPSEWTALLDGYAEDLRAGRCSHEVAPTLPRTAWIAAHAS